MPLFAGVVPADEAIQVKTAVLADITIYPERSAPATVISLNDTNVSARIPAQVEEIPVQVGDIVDKGRLLVRLDCTDHRLTRIEYEARLESLQARIGLSKRKLERTRSLLEKQSVAAELLDEQLSDLEVLQAEMKATRAQLSMAKLNEDRCQVVSPFRALILDRISSVGQFAGIGTGLIRIIDIDQLEVSAQIFNRETPQLGNAKKIYFQLDDSRYPLKLKKIVPAINTDTRNQEVRLLFHTQPALPGAAGKLVWIDVQAHVPGNLLVNRGGRPGIFYINDGVAHFHAIPGAQIGRMSPVNIPAETKIVIEGHYALTDSVPVHEAE